MWFELYPRPKGRQVKGAGAPKYCVYHAALAAGEEQLLEMPWTGCAGVREVKGGDHVETGKQTIVY